MVEVGLAEHAVLGALFVHGLDAGLPFWIRSWDGKADIGDNAGVIPRDPLSDCFDQDRARSLVVETVGELGFAFHLSEEEVGGARHAELAHVLLVYELDGGVSELFPDHASEFGPVRESVSASAVEWGVFVVVVVVAGPFGGIVVLFPKVYPPVLRFPSE